MPVRVRPATAEDVPSVLSAFEVVLRDVPYYNDLAKAHERQKYGPDALRKKLRADADSIIVAQDGAGPVVGFCINHFDDFTIWIDWFGVVPAARGNHTGEALVAAVCDRAPQRKAHKVWCDTRANNEPSRRLLEKSGFRELVTIANHWYGQDFTLWERMVHPHALA